MREFLGGAAEGRRLNSWLAPSLGDVLLVAWVAGFCLTGWDALLADGDTGWHIRTGERILATGAVPRADPYSFTKFGEPWFAWEWLSQLVLAAAFRLAGLKGVVLAAGVLIAGFGLLLVRWMLWRGASPVAALPVALLALGASSVHFLARPHLFTWWLLAISLWLWERDTLRSDRWVWLLVPLSALWANLHGGFAAWLASLAALTVAQAVEAALGWRPAPAYAPALRSALIWLACAAATLANPYGWQLHAHLVQYLSADWIRDAVLEFRSPVFRTENTFLFELLLFAGLMAAAALAGRRRLAPAVLILLWAHAALVSARHIPIYVIVAAPVIATELSALWLRLAAPRTVAATLERVAADWASQLGRISVWPAVAVAALAVGPIPVRWPEDFPERRFPVAMVSRQEQVLQGAPVFAYDEWADYLIYRLGERARVFLDGRSDFFGPELVSDYLAVWSGRHDWEQILERHACGVVLVPASAAIASLLKLSRNWRLVDDDGQAALFVRRAVNAAADSLLNSAAVSAELPHGVPGP
jgi:hypothetical protein